MSTRKYAVLRAVRPLSSGASFDESLGPNASGAGGRGTEPLEPKIDIEDLGRGDLRELMRDRSVACAAPVMPLKLIEPLAVSGTASQTAWGIGAIGADKSAYDGSGVIIAVLDTGVDPKHPAFAGVKLVEKDFTGEGNGDLNGHGTHCAGTILGRDVGGTRIGVARGVSTALIGKVLKSKGGGTSADLFTAMQWAVESDAKVISMSLGFDFPGLVKELVGNNWPADLATSRALEAYRANLRMFDALMGMFAARAAFDGGVLVIAAAGNESHREVNPEYEIAVSLPAAAAGVIAVGACALGAEGYTMAPFSNTLPELTGPGVGIVSAKAGTKELVALSGTSMACPHVAGAAALWWQMARERPPASARSVTARLLAAARADVFAANTDSGDRGVGFVRAPE